MRAISIVTVASLATAIACGDGGAALDTREQPVVSISEAAPGLLARAQISGDRALAIARTEVPNGRVVEAELEDEDGQFVYDVHVRVDDGAEFEVLIDAMTGVVVAVETEDDDGHDDDDGHEDDHDEPEHRQA